MKRIPSMVSRLRAAVVADPAVVAETAVVAFPTVMLAGFVYTGTVPLDVRM
jgi:hypothetical protein